MQFSLLWIIFVPSLYFPSERTNSTFHPGEEDFVCTLPNCPPPSTEKMKGFLRGLKYISQMFDEKEPEMQIGLPTDVKHVAHIGMDGPAANKPSWMTEFSAAPELSSVPVNDSPKQKPPAAGNHESSLPPLANANENKPKKSRRKASIGGSGSPLSSPRASSEKPSRRNRSSNLSMESTGRESPNHARRSNRGTESSSSSQELPDIPKKSRRKKSKGSSEGGSGSEKSRSKGQNSMPDVLELGP